MPTKGIFERADESNKAVGAHTDILTTPLENEQGYPVVFRTYAVLNTATKFHVIRVDDGAYTASEILNASVDLAVNSAYSFDVPVLPGETINYQTEDAVTVISLKVTEVRE